ncbi:MAG: DUF3772 domain-containing protein [Rhodospirillales bacterium]
MTREQRHLSPLARATALLAVGVVFLLTALTPPVASAQGADETLAAVARQWHRTLDLIERYVQSGDHSAELHDTYSGHLEGIASDAGRLHAEAERQIAAKSRLLEALGPPPAEGEPREPPDVAGERRQLTQSIAAFKAQMAQAELARTRARELQGALSEAVRARFIEQLFARDRSPLAPEVFAKGAPEFVGVLGQLAHAPIEWYRGLTREQRQSIWLNWRMSFFLVALMLGFVIRRALLRRLGPDPQIEDPSYTRRFVAAIAKAVADGILPAGIVAAVYIRIRAETELISGLAANVLASLCLLLIFFALSRALTRAVLAPELLSWRLTRLTSQAAGKLSRRIMALAVIVAISLFFKGLRDSVPELPVTSEVVAFYVFVIGTLQALGLVLIMLGDGWRTKTDGGPEEVAPAEPPAPAGAAGGAGGAGEPEQGHRYADIARYVVMGVAVLGVAAAAAGYVRLGFYLVDNLVVSTATVAALFLARGILRELTGLVLKTEVLKTRLGLKASTRQTLKFWLRAILDPILVGLGLYVIAQYWGVPPGDMANWIASVLAGFTVGGVTISLVDIALALIVFAVALVATRMVRQGLAETILPRTSLDTGVRNSIATGAGYIGVVVAVLMAIGVLGIDLSNIAIVAGALSVGIGFGLQNIVNNFVSGLILLVERPIKVGDWVVVGTNQGYVKRINVRATEITTFERASVILPNSELLSSAVMNWTHKDKMGRVEVRVGVAYGSDTAKVRELLLACAKAHPEVMSWPAPFVLFLNFGGSSLDFELRAFLRDVEKRLSVGSDLRFAIDAAFREAGIEIPFSQHDIHLRDIDRLEQALAALSTGTKGIGAGPKAPDDPTEATARTSVRPAGDHQA